MRFAFMDFIILVLTLIPQRIVTSILNLNQGHWEYNKCSRNLCTLNSSAFMLDGKKYWPIRIQFRNNIYSIDVNTDNYLPPFAITFFVCYQIVLLGWVNIPDTIGWFSQSRFRFIGIGKYSYLTPSPSSVLH